MAPAMAMSENSTEEYTAKMRGRYARMTGRKARSKLLDEFVEVTGWERKHANKVLLGIKPGQDWRKPHKIHSPIHQRNAWGCRPKPRQAEAA